MGLFDDKSKEELEAIAAEEAEEARIAQEKADAEAAEAAAAKKAAEEALAKKVAEIARRRNAPSITSDSGPGETTSGTFGASVNEATGARGPGTGFSDYS